MSQAMPFSLNNLYLGWAEGWKEDDRELCEIFIDGKIGNRAWIEKRSMSSKDSDRHGMAHRRRKWTMDLAFD